MQLSVLSANVGNLDLRCRKYLNKPCFVEVEEKIAANIANLKPAIIALQEVMTLSQCQKANETDPKKVCFEYDKKKYIEQARRLVGPDYTIVCEPRNGYECIALRTDVGTIEDCPTEVEHLPCRGVEPTLKHLIDQFFIFQQASSPQPRPHSPSSPAHPHTVRPSQPEVQP